MHDSHYYQLKQFIHKKFQHHYSSSSVYFIFIFFRESLSLPPPHLSPSPSKLSSAEVSDCHFFPLAIPLLYFLQLTYESAHSVSVPFLLIDFTQHDILLFHPHNVKLYDCIFSYSQIIFHCVYILYNFLLSDLFLDTWFSFQILSIVNGAMINRNANNNDLYRNRAGYKINAETMQKSMAFTKAKKEIKEKQIVSFSPTQFFIKNHHDYYHKSQFKTCIVHPIFLYSTKNKIVLYMLCFKDDFIEINNCKWFI